MLSGQGPSGPWSPFLPLGVFLDLYSSSTMLNWLDAPKELQAAYLWDHSGAPALALILGRWPEKQLFLRRVVSSLVRLGETKPPYMYRLTDDSHLGDTSSWLWGTHGPLSTLGLPCVGCVYQLSPLHVAIWQCLVSVLPPPPQGSNGGIILPLFWEPPFTGTRRSKLLPAQSSRDLWHSPQRAFQLLACHSSRSSLTDTFTRLQIFMFKPCWWERGILCTNRTTHLCLLLGSSLPLPSP